MSTVRFNLLDGNQPVQIDMVDAKIKQQQLKSDAYGQTASNRLLPRSRRDGRLGLRRQ